MSVSPSNCSNTLQLSDHILCTNSEANIGRVARKATWLPLHLCVRLSPLEKCNHSPSTILISRSVKSSNSCTSRASWTSETAICRPKDSLAWGSRRRSVACAAPTYYSRRAGKHQCETVEDAEARLQRLTSEGLRRTSRQYSRSQSRAEGVSGST